MLSFGIAHRAVAPPCVAPGPGLTVTFLTWLVLAQGGVGYEPTDSSQPSVFTPLVFFSLQSLCLVHTGKPTGVAVSHCITWFQTQIILNPPPPPMRMGPPLSKEETWPPLLMNPPSRKKKHACPPPPEIFSPNRA